MRDTSPKMMQKMRDMMQEKTPQERLAMGCSMIETSRQLVIRFILQEQPNISEKDLRKELFLKFYDNDFSEEQKEKILKHLDSLDP